MRLDSAAYFLLIFRIHILGRIYEFTPSQEILVDLLKTIIEKFKPMMTFSKPESDNGLLLWVKDFPNYEL